MVSVPIMGVSGSRLGSFVMVRGRGDRGGGRETTSSLEEAGPGGVVPEGSPEAVRGIAAGRARDPAVHDSVAGVRAVLGNSSGCMLPGRVAARLRHGRPSAAQHGRVPPRSPYDNLVHPRTVKKPVPQIAAERDLVVEDPSSGFVGAVVRCEKDVVHLEDRFGKVRAYPLGPGFWVDGRPVVLVRPKPKAPAGPSRSASGSTYVAGARARVAREGRIYVEGTRTPSCRRRSGATTCASRASSSSRCMASTTCRRSSASSAPARDGASACWSTTWSVARRSRGSPSR